MADERVPVVDAVVHCVVPTFDALYPYLTGHWPEFLRRSTVSHHHAGKYSYPAWSSALSMDPQAMTLERLQEQVFERSDYAILNCHWGVDSVTHPDLAAELQRALNSWLRDEWLDRDDRLFGSIAINPNHAEAAVAEIERAAQDRRFVQVLLPVRSREQYGSERYWPIWEAAARNDLVLALVYGGAAGTPPTNINWLGSFAEDYVVHTLTFAAQVMSFIVSGVLQKWPTIRLSLVESGWSWLPAFTWRMDGEWKAHYAEVPWVQDLPSTYLRRFFRYTTQPADLTEDAVQVAQVLEQLGDAERGAEDLLMYSSDYPHRYRHGVERLLDGMEPTQIDKIMGGNAYSWYGLAARVGATVG
jgi:predicted TIM-barrel fold metal-dependent hydrolase